MRRSWREIATSILVSTGVYMVDQHMALNVGETIRIPSELRTKVSTLVVRGGDELVAGLGLCAEHEPPIELLWLSPIGEMICTRSIRLPASAAGDRLTVVRFRGGYRVELIER